MGGIVSKKKIKQINGGNYGTLCVEKKSTRIELKCSKERLLLDLLEVTSYTSRHIE
jgi:hypothetical protein